MNTALPQRRGGEDSDGVDFADVIRSLQRGWRAVLAYTVLGIVAAAGVVLFAPRQFDGTASIVVRADDPGLSILSRLTSGGGGGIGGEAASALVGSKTQLETELQVLESRAIAARVIDSLLLQARVKRPESTPARALLAGLALPGSFRKQTVSFSRREDGGYRVKGGGLDTVVAPGATIPFLTGTITLVSSLPREFRLQFLDHEDALKRFSDHLEVEKAGGEVAAVTFSGDDSVTAALAANLLVSEYLGRRKTTDRGINHRRVEFLIAQLDSTGRQLSTAERALRDFQESSGVLDAKAVGEVALERAGELRGQMTLVQVEEGAINQLLSEVERGELSTRQLLAYPAFLRSAALNEMLGQLHELEAQRTQLLERRTERDPEVLALTQSIKSIEGQFVPMAKSYSQTLARQRQEFELALDTLRKELGILPGAAESGNRLTRDVLRLGQIYTALQAQLVEARLAAIGEGGDVRPLDVAFPAKKPSFPRPVMTLGIGGSAGLFMGMVAALVLAAFGRYARDPREIERTTGVPTLMFDRRTPLVVSNGVMRTVLVIPLHARADSLAVARQLVETSMSRANTATLLDLAGGAEAQEPTIAAVASTGTAVASPAARVDVPGAIARLSSEFDHVVVRLPGLAADATLAAMNHERPVVFVVPPERVERETLVGAMRMLERLEVPCAGIVVSGTPATSRARALVS